MTIDANKKKLIFITTFLLTLLFVSLFISLFLVKSSLSKINCESRINFIDINNNLNAKVYFIFNLDEEIGWLKISGKINQEQNEIEINRRLYFTYHRNKNIFTLMINEITNEGDDLANSLLTDILPLAYMHENTKMDIFIYPQSYGEYLFSSSNFNSFYCQANL